jgi:hypothetical protein
MDYFHYIQLIPWSLLLETILYCLTENTTLYWWKNHSQYLSYNAKEIQMIFVSLLFCHTILKRFKWCLCHYYLIRYLPYNTTEIRMMPVSLLFDTILAIQYYTDSIDEWIITVWYNTCHKMLQRFEWCLRHYRLIQYLPYKTRDLIDELIITVWYNTCHTILQRFEWCLCHYRLIQYLPYNTTEIRLMNGSLPFDIIVAMQYYRD